MDPGQWDTFQISSNNFNQKQFQSQQKHCDFSKRPSNRHCQTNGCQFGSRKTPRAAFMALLHLVLTCVLKYEFEFLRPV